MAGKVHLISKGAHLSPMPDSLTASARPATGNALYDPRPHSGVLGGNAPSRIMRSNGAAVKEATAVFGIRSRINTGQRIRWEPPRPRDE